MGTEEESVQNKDITSGLNNVFLASTEYVCDLPDLSYNPRQFPYPYNLQKYSEYITPHFAKNYVNDDFIGCDNPFGIDFLNLDKYDNVSSIQEMLDPEDLKLLVDSNQNSLSKNRTLNHTKNISWLRKTEYISAETVRNTKMSDLVDRQLMQNAEIYQKCTDSYKSLSSQIDAINTTFDDNKIDPSLHTKKPRDVKPIEIIPILPITDLPSSNKCAHVSFDSHPTFYGSDKAIDSQDAANALLRGLSDQDGDYAGYYIPKKIPMSLESIVHTENEDNEKCLQYYQLLREYNWNINSTSSNMVNDIYAFVENPQSGAFEYMAISSKIKLNKRLFADRSTENLSEGIPHMNLIVEEEDFGDSIKNEEEEF